jgi:uncharacterized protein YuzE
MKTTRYFEEQMLRKRPYIQGQWCERVLAAPVRREVQRDGRIRHWGRITVVGEARPRFLRVVTLEDGENRPQRFFRSQFPRGRAMKLHYYPETDSLYIELKDAPGTQTREIVEGLVVDLDANGDVVGFDIDHASGKLDLSKIETIALPPATAAE